LLNPDRFTPNGGTEYKGVRKLDDWCISETVQDTAIVDYSKKSNRKPYPSYGIKALSMTLSDRNPQFKVTLQFEGEYIYIANVHATATVTTELK